MITNQHYERSYRVLGLSVLSQDTWSNLVDLANKLIHLVIGEMFLVGVNNFLIGKESFLTSANSL